MGDFGLSANESGCSESLPFDCSSKEPHFLGLEIGFNLLLGCGHSGWGDEGDEGLTLVGWALEPAVEAAVLRRLTFEKLLLADPLI